MKNIPKLRFKEFSGEWEEKKLGTIIEKYEDPVETPTEGYMRLGLRSHAKGTFHSYVEKGKELETAKMFRVAPNKFILNITFAWEHAVAITSPEDKGMLVSHRFPQFSFNEETLPLFFGYLILDKKFKNHLELSSPGGAGRNRVLKIKDMLEYKMKFPSKEEQQKIVDFLSSVDKKISIVEEKLNLFNQYKKGIMQKIFSQKLRFKDENGNNYPEWEEKKLGDISSNIMYGLNSSAIDFDGENKYIRITDINEKNGKFSPNPLTSPDGKFDDNFLVKENDILFARTGASVGKTYHYDKKDGKLYFAGFLIRFNIEKANSKFIYYNTLRNNYKKWVVLTSMRTGQPGINAEEYKNYKVKLPCLEEQKKIADFLSAIDNKIENISDNLESLKLFKKSLLQKMFV